MNVPTLCRIVLEHLEQNLELVPTADHPKVMINAAVLFLVDIGYIVLLPSGPSLTRAGRFCTMALRGRL